MYDRISRSLPPIPSPVTAISYLKLFPPDDPIYVRLLGSRIRPYTDADIFRYIHVPPDDIQYISPRFGERQWHLAGRVIDGDWDLDPIRFDEASFIEGVDAPFHPSLEMHFVEGVPWEETPFVQEVIDYVEEGNTTWTCSDRQDVEEKCARVDRLYQRIKEQGYMTQEQRRRAGISDLKPSRQVRLYRWMKDHTVVGKDEIVVNIARDGTFLRYSGKHRLSIAKILDLDSIPVLVLARHRSWQDVRDALNDADDPSAALSSEYLDHPDLQDLITTES